MQQRRLCVSYISTITSSAALFDLCCVQPSSHSKAACPPTQAMGMLIFPLFLVESYLSLLSTGSSLMNVCLSWACGLKQPPGPEGSIQHSQTLHPLTCSKASLAFSSHLASLSPAAWGHEGVGHELVWKMDVNLCPGRRLS